MAGFCLGIDTAGPVIGAALWSEVRGLSGRWSSRVVRGADAELLPAIANLLDRLDEPVDRVAVSVGPGAFTGLRVGVAAALGIAVARGVGVVPLSSLRVRAALVKSPRVLALLDARKGRVYAGLFDASGAELSPECDVPPELAMPEGPFDAVGEGAVVHGEVVRAAGGRLVEDPDRSPASDVARLGWHHDPIDPAQVALHYLRAPDARKPDPR